MSKHIVTGIDIGTYHVKVVIAETGDHSSPPRIIGTGFAKSKGLRHGYIMSSADISSAIKTAISQASDQSGVRVKDAYISFGGVGLEEERVNGKTLISRVDSEVSESDLEETITDAKNSIKRNLINKKILHPIPLKYFLDGEEVLGSPVGMHGAKLEAEILFVTALTQHHDDLVASVEDLGIEVLEVTAAPIAASLVTLNKTQKMAGCVLANIGAETVSIVVYEDNTPISIKVFPVGSSNITNDIALNLKIPLIEAEQIKLGAVTGTDYPRKKLEGVITIRIKDIFKLIESHLKKIGKSGLLPAGIILTGGGSSAVGLEDLAKSVLKLPSEVASMRLGTKVLKDSTWAVAYGLCIQAANNENSSTFFGKSSLTLKNSTGWLKKFLP